MNNITYLKNDLVTFGFTHDGVKSLEGHYKLHACNCLGRWGRGIALAFKRSYPGSYKEYEAYCQTGNNLGKAFITSENVVCLMTSYGYDPADPAGSILKATANALSELGHALPNGSGMIYSNRFNSGLFGVPWEQTESLIEQFLKAFPNVRWIVFDP